MKKTILLLALILISFFKLSAGDVLMMSDFEDNSTAPTSWVGADGYSSLITTDNPASTGINKSSKVLSVTMTDGGWVGIYSRNTPVINITNSGYRYFHCKILKEAVSKILVTLKTSTNTEKLPLSIACPADNSWQEFTVDMLNNVAETWGVQEGEYASISIQPLKYDYVGTYPVTIYIDDIYFSNSETPEENLSMGLTETMKEKINISRIDNNAVKIQLPESDGKSSMKIYNMQGQLLKTINNVGSEFMEVNLPHNNFYLLQISGTKGTSNIKF